MLDNFLKNSSNYLGANATQNNYFQFQRDLAVYNLQSGLQNAMNVANQVKLQAAQQGVSAAQATVLAMLVSQNSIDTHKQTIQQTRMIQSFNNQLADRNKVNLIQAASELQNSMMFNYRILDKQILQGVGKAEQTAVERRVVASQGKSADLVTSVKEAGKKEQGTLIQNSLKQIRQAYENATAIEVSKAFDTWNTESQIDFSNKVLRNSMIF